MRDAPSVRDVVVAPITDRESEHSGNRPTIPPMNVARTNRIAGWSGIAFSVLSLVVLPLAQSAPPPLGGTGQELGAWYVAHRTPFLIGNYLGIVAFVPGFVQLAVLVARVRQSGKDGGWLAPFVASAGTFAYAVFACSLVTFQALPFIVEPNLERPMEAANALATIWFALDGLAALPLVIAVGWAAAETHILPRWFVPYTWVTALLALAMSAGALTKEPPWLAAGGLVTGVGFIAFFVWTFVLGVLFLRRTEDPPTGDGKGGS